MTKFTYGSVCSGIEAASVAWHDIGEPLWLSEIDKFPSAVLAHRYPTVPNLGDMTALPGMILNRAVPAPLRASRGSIGGGSETLVVHGTQDPITSTNTALCLGRNNGQENILLDVAHHRDGCCVVIAGQALVRKLTPVECERLQGFPDDWTKVPYRGKSADDCPDSPRYKAIGNSMAVPVMRWIGKRLRDKVT